MSDRAERRRRTENKARRRRRDADAVLVWPRSWPEGMMRKTSPLGCPCGRCFICNPEKGTPTMQERRVDADEGEE